MADFFKYLLKFILLVLCISAEAQDIIRGKTTQLENIIESLEEQTDGQSENSQTLEDLSKFSADPLNINTANAEELEKLYFLDFQQVQNLIKYRNEYGPILSLQELQAVKSFSAEVVRSIEPFICFNQEQYLSGFKQRRTIQQLILRSKSSLPVSRGYSSVSEQKAAAYPGIPAGLYLRYHLEAGKFESGFTADHDAGERLFTGENNRGFDYYSGFISWKSESFIHRIIIGDYALKFGQGINLWSTSGFGKSGEVLNILKAGQGVSPYTSTDENLFFRGVAAVLGKGSLKVMLYYSNKNKDANLEVDKNSGDTVFTSFKTTGYHRTNSEIEDEKILKELDTGIYGELRVNGFRMGGLFSYTRFNYAMIKGSADYRAKNFSGIENTNTGIDYQFSFRKIQLFGEAGMSMNQKVSLLQGLKLNLNPQLRLSFYYRHFDPGFVTFYGNPFSEASNSRNETGYYNGMELFPLKKIKISAYADFYRFPWLTYSTSAPSKGKDFLVQIDWSIIKNWTFYIRAKSEIKPKKHSDGDELPFDMAETVNKFRFNNEIKLKERICIRNRFEGVYYKFADSFEKGYLFYQDFNWSFSRNTEFWLRYVKFNTSGYNSRIYTYENDVLYNFSLPEFHGKGERIYLNLKWKPLQKATFYLKTGYTIHKGEKDWGSGNDLTQGSCRLDLKGEIFIRF